MPVTYTVEFRCPLAEGEEEGMEMPESHKDFISTEAISVVRGPGINLKKKDTLIRVRRGIHATTYGDPTWDSASRGKKKSIIRDPKGNHFTAEYYDTRANTEGWYTFHFYCILARNGPIKNTSSLVEPNPRIFDEPRKESASENYEIKFLKRKTYK